MTKRFIKVGLAICLLSVMSSHLVAQSDPDRAADEEAIASGEELPPDESLYAESNADELNAAADVSSLTDAPCEDPDCEATPALAHDWFAPQTVYRRRASGTHWLPAGQDQLGWFSLRSDPYLDSEESFGVIGGINIDWLDGPIQPNLPPRVYSFQMGLQFRDQLTSNFSFDLAGSIGVFSDFEDSARDGIQYPSHAVGFLHVDNQLDFVFGVDYLDRDDIKILPVIGLVLRDPCAKIRAELVFPRPKIAIEIDSVTALVLKAQLGGGSWDIEQPDETNDVFTYRDYSVSIGWETLEEEGNSSAVEFGIVFDRRLEFRNSSTEYGLDNSFILRCVEYY